MPAGIAMVYNLVSKLDNRNGEEWLPMLEALRDRAIIVADKFSAQDIALVYNLISKLDDP